MATQIKKSVCMWCHCHCKVDVHVTDGRLEKIEGVTNDPRSEGIRRTVAACARPRAAGEYLYHPDRLRYPLKRKGERGEGKWEEICWEKALDEVAQKLAALKTQYGAETLASSSGTYRTHDEYRMRFLNLFGTSNNVGQGHI